MGTYLDHPLRIARLTARLGQNELAARANVNRSTISAIEEGRTRTPDEGTMLRLARVLAVDAQLLGSQIAAWNVRHRRPELNLTPSALYVLRLQPQLLGRRFSSFQRWREAIVASPTGFASLVGVNRRTLTLYETGKRQRPGMPVSLWNAIHASLAVSADYLVELEALPRGE